MNVTKKNCLGGVITASHYGASVSGVENGSLACINLNSMSSERNLILIVAISSELYCSAAVSVKFI